MWWTRPIPKSHTHTNILPHDMDTVGTHVHCDNKTTATSCDLELNKNRMENSCVLWISYRCGAETGPWRYHECLHEYRHSLQLDEYFTTIAAVFMSVWFGTLQKPVMWTVRKMATYVLDLLPVQRGSCISVACEQHCTTFSLRDHIMGRSYYELKTLIR